MAEAKPFIPRDKPKLWVLMTLACLCGLALGILVFAAAWVGIPWVSSLMALLLICCCLVGVICGIAFTVNLLMGRYRSLHERPWSEQQW